jgi:hypothetical protein
VSTLVARNSNEAMVAPTMGSSGVFVGGSLESGGRFCVAAFGSNLASEAVRVFSHLIFFVKKN